MKTWIINFGVATAVAAMNAHGLTVGKVLIAPLPIEYGRGQRRIMHRSLIPSCLSVSERAAKRLSVATMRRAKLRKN